ncbi:site-specific DNA-methyltransferase [Ligilactobacillus acidipiscis]|uniref:site-specific DNA-methyltransferase n=1 Tax=Ligilactobacillus acidipiscis TaxID=89059 RepID=UPI003869301A
MELSYGGKKAREDILKKALSVKFKTSLTKKEKNLLIKADNFLGLSFLLQNGYKGKIDLIYIDPPFSTNIDYRISNSRNNTVSMSKKGLVAYSDKLAESEFIEFLRERIILLYELLSDKGSFYLHIDGKIGHYVKIILDEIFGQKNFLNDITRKKSNPKNFFRRAYGNEKDVIYFYAKNRENNIWNDVREPMSRDELISKYKKIDQDGRRYNTVPVHAPGESSGETGGLWKGIFPPEGRHWRSAPHKLDELDKQGLIEWSSTGNPRIKKYADENKGKKIQDIWLHFKDSQSPDYPTQKNLNMLEMIVKQSSTEDSIVLDAFAGSGNTLLACKELDRHFIGIDQSEIAFNLMKKRLIDNSLFEIPTDIIVL